MVMEPKIEFVPSAFRHGFTEEDIHWVLNNYLVFHAMECRKKWLLKLGLEE